MNLTIPIRAGGSTNSWTRRMRVNSSPRYISRRMKSDRLRYIFTMVTAVFLVGTLAVGSLTGLMSTASARDNYSSRSNNNYGGSNNNRNSDRNQPTSQSNRNTSNSSSNSSNTTTTARTTTTPTPAKSPTPVVTQAPATPTPPSVAEAAPVQVATSVTPQIVSQPAIAAPVEDTAPAIASMTAAQTDKDTKSVAYTSAALSDESRNRVLMLAGVAAITGTLFYILSMMGAAAPVSRTAIPVRYIVPVREVATS